jgi:hypothetical protein
MNFLSVHYDGLGLNSHCRLYCFPLLPRSGQVRATIIFKFPSSLDGSFHRERTAIPKTLTGRAACLTATAVAAVAAASADAAVAAVADALSVFADVAVVVAVAVVTAVAFTTAVVVMWRSLTVSLPPSVQLFPPSLTASGSWQSGVGEPHKDARRGLQLPTAG